MWSNFHTHSTYCDGKAELAAYVQKAQDRKMVSLGFSSHAPLPFPCKWCMKPESLDTYLTEVESLNKLATQIELYKSLEIDFIPGVISPNDFKSRLDYTVGSIHFVEILPDGTPWEIDGPHNSFLEGYEKIFKSNIRDTITRYFELTREMINTSYPTIIGHLDKIKIQNVEGKFFHESDSWYCDEVLKTLNLIKESGAIVEVNTRGIYQKKSATPYPSPWILEIIHQKNIPITLSSDAHHPNDLVNQFEEIASGLLEIGFKKLTILKEGKWKPFEFTKHGIIPTRV